MLESERVLGPRWSVKELRAFYILLKAYGRQWDALEERLPLRTNAMIRGLYDMHRGYLSLPEASVEGFCTIMMDHYKTLDEMTATSNSSTMDTMEESEHSSSITTDTNGVKVKVEMNAKGSITSNSVDNGTEYATPVAGRSLQDGLVCDNQSRKRELGAQLSTSGTPSATPPTALGGNSHNNLVPKPLKTKKKRRLDQLLALEGPDDQLEKRTQLHLQIQSESDSEMPSTENHTASAPPSARTGSRVKTRIPALLQSRRFRSSLNSPHFSAINAKKKFDLPWYHWFYSYIDADFFNHNEFVECLNRMGLGKITVAARPVWSSVRASMGRPRRLSPLFLSQEKNKLNTYRELKRQINNDKPPESWPYQCSTPMSCGATVIVWIETQQCFYVGTVLNFSSRDGVCNVKLLNGDTDSVICNFDSVMVLPDGVSDRLNVATSYVNTKQEGSQHKVMLAQDPSSDTITSDYRLEKIKAMLVVRDLLHRKEQLVLALSNVNKQIGQQHNIYFMTNARSVSEEQSMYVPIRSLGDRTMLQGQFSWLAMNLDITNQHLKLALRWLQDLSSDMQTNGTANNAQAAMGFFLDQASNPITDSNEPLSLEHMRWAIDFITLCQQKSTSLVSDVMQQVANEDMTNSDQLVLPETKQLVASCISLISVIRRGLSPDIPPMITQKVIYRMLELLTPRHEANMDLYAELQTAAEGIYMSCSQR